MIEYSERNTRIDRIHGRCYAKIISCHMTVSIRHKSGICFTNIKHIYLFIHRTNNI